MPNLLFSCLFFLLVSGVVLAQVPLFLNFQGQLLQKIWWDEEDYDIWPVRDQAVEMIFRLYTSATGGGAVWYETHTSVLTNYEGVYNVQLGSQTPLALDARPYWIGITIDTNDEMSPRLSLGSSLSALMVRGLDLRANSEPPHICNSASAGTIALTSNYAPCICNGEAWLFIGQGLACQWE